MFLRLLSSSLEYFLMKIIDILNQVSYCDIARLLGSLLS